jgi:hypothetical protein
MGQRHLLNHRHAKRRHHKGVYSQSGHHDCTSVIAMDSSAFASWAEGSLRDVSFEHKVGKYDYSFESGGNVIQIDTDDHNKEYKLGNHDEYREMQEIFNNGDNCGSHGKRHGSIQYSFGSEADHKVMKVREHPTCVYTFTVQLSETLCPTTTTTTTLACDTAPMDEFAGMTFSHSQTSTLHGNAEYTYTIEVGGAVTQVTSNAGTFRLGTHQSYDGATEEFGGGDSCGSRSRSAKVFYTFGATSELLKASEPSTCRYEFEIQLPHAVSAFAGRTYNINQTSTRYGNAEYTYYVEVGGEITQITSDAGSFSLGTHASFEFAPTRPDPVEKFEDGDPCSGGKKRSATVTYTYGTEAKIISADEPEECVYNFEIQLPEQDCR